MCVRICYMPSFVSSWLTKHFLMTSDFIFRFSRDTEIRIHASVQFGCFWRVWFGSIGQKFHVFMSLNRSNITKISLIWQQGYTHWKILWFSLRETPFQVQKFEMRPNLTKLELIYRAPILNEQIIMPKASWMVLVRFGSVRREKSSSSVQTYS